MSEPRVKFDLEVLTPEEISERLKDGRMVLLSVDPQDQIDFLDSERRRWKAVAEQLAEALEMTRHVFMGRTPEMNHARAAALSAFDSLTGDGRTPATQSPVSGSRVAPQQHEAGA